MTTSQELPDPAVPPAAYTEEWFRTTCGDSSAWSPDGTKEIGGIYLHALDRLGFQPGQVLVDLGCGRGELIVLAAQKGAKRAIGIEYAPAAVDLALQTVAGYGVGDRAEVLLADVRDVPVGDAEADALTLLDVVEHLTSDELDRALTQARRILRPGGRLFAHTFPNRLLYDVTYRLQRSLVPWRWKTWPADPRNELERLMHVNEQSRSSLRRSLQNAGFNDIAVTHGEWIYTDFVPDEGAKRIYGRLARYRITEAYGRANILAHATNP